MKTYYSKTLQLSVVLSIVLATTTIALAEHGGLIDERVFKKGAGILVCFSGDTDCFTAISLGFRASNQQPDVARRSSKTVVQGVTVRKGPHECHQCLFLRGTQAEITKLVRVDVHGHLGWWPILDITGVVEVGDFFE